MRSPALLPAPQLEQQALPCVAGADADRPHSLKLLQDRRHALHLHPQPPRQVFHRHTQEAMFVEIANQVFRDKAVFTVNLRAEFAVQILAQADGAGHHRPHIQLVILQTRLTRLQVRSIHTRPTAAVGPGLGTQGTHIHLIRFQGRVLLQLLLNDLLQFQAGQEKHIHPHDEHRRWAHLLGLSHLHVELHDPLSSLSPCCLS